MLSCVFCHKQLNSSKGLSSHYNQVHDPHRKVQNHHGVNNPMFGRKGRNHYTNRDWSLVPWDELGSFKRRERMLVEAGYACSQCGYNQRRNDGGIILEIDHIDGDHKNNVRTNLRVLCPNCHALTPNFRNWGREVVRKKASTRSYRTNAGKKQRAVASKLLRQQEAKYETYFRNAVQTFHETGRIDFSRYGWVQQLSDELNEPYPVVVAKRIRRLMPAFYAEHCYARARKRIQSSAPV